jgi:hypothetical protein
MPQEELTPGYRKLFRNFFVLCLVSEIHLKIRVKDVSISSDWIGNSRVSHRTILKMEPLHV